MSKHTPGPWKVYPKSSDPALCNVIPIGPENAGYIVYVRNTTITDTGRANAELIAASPDLLEACEAQQALIEDMSRFIGSMALKDYQLFNDAPIMTKRAIAKARGGDPK